MRAEVGLVQTRVASEPARFTLPRFAVKAIMTGIDLGTVGMILMVIGAVGLAVGPWLTLTGRGSADQST